MLIYYHFVELILLAPMYIDRVIIQSGKEQLVRLTFACLTGIGWLLDKELLMPIHIIVYLILGYLFTIYVTYDNVREHPYNPYHLKTATKVILIALGPLCVAIGVVKLLGEFFVAALVETFTGIRKLIVSRWLTPRNNSRWGSWLLLP